MGLLKNIMCRALSLMLPNTEMPELLKDSLTLDNQKLAKLLYSTQPSKRDDLQGWLVSRGHAPPPPPLEVYYNEMRLGRKKFLRPKFTTKQERVYEWPYNERHREK